MRAPITGLLVGALVLLSACRTPPAAAAQPVFSQASADAPVVHGLSGFAFPAQVGDFRRQQASQYSPSGDDISFGYNNYGVRVVATIYVYATHGRALEQEFAAKQAEVTGGHPGAQLLSTTEVRLTAAQRPAHAASYGFTGPFGQKVMELRSELVVAQAGDWFVEYRLTYPAALQPMAEPQVAAFESGFAWPDAPGR